VESTVLSAAEARQLLDSIDAGRLVGLLDRALVGFMVYAFAGVGAPVTAMRVEDYFQQGSAGGCASRKRGEAPRISGAP